jgi:hypothetical protein
VGLPGSEINSLPIYNAEVRTEQYIYSSVSTRLAQGTALPLLSVLQNKISLMRR